LRNIERGLSIAGDMIIQLIPKPISSKENIQQTMSYLHQYHYVAVIASRAQISKLLQPYYECYLH
jgi:hypothetical protein